MKKILPFPVLLLLPLLLLCSCGDDSHSLLSGPPSTRGFVSVSLGNGGDGEAEQINTVRLIAFDNATKLNCTVDMNEFHDFAGSSGQFKQILLTLQVSNHPDKMLAAIVNEPAGLKDDLDKVSGPDELERLKLSLDSFLDDQHEGLKPNSRGLPLTGIRWAGSAHGFPVYETQAQAEANRCTLRVERAVARVEVYIRAAADVSAAITPGGTVSLKRTLNESFFVTGTEDDGSRYQSGADAFKNFGHTLNPDATKFLTKTHTYTNTTPILTIQEDGKLGEPICSFYTPERYCKEAGHKLGIGFKGISREGSDLFGGNEETVWLENAMFPQIDEMIRRNHIYRLVCTIGEADLDAIEFSVSVQPWDKEDFDIPWVVE